MEYILIALLTIDGSAIAEQDRIAFESSDACRTAEAAYLYEYGAKSRAAPRESILTTETYVTCIPRWALESIKAR